MIPIPIPVNRGANPGYFPDPGQIGIPRFPEIPAESGSGQNPEYFPDPGPIGIGRIPAIFPAKSGRGGTGIRGFRGLAWTGHDEPEAAARWREPAAHSEERCQLSWQVYEFSVYGTGSSRWRCCHRHSGRRTGRWHSDYARELASFMAPGSAATEQHPPRVHWLGAPALLKFSRCDRPRPSRQAGRVPLRSHQPRVAGQPARDDVRFTGPLRYLAASASPAPISACVSVGHRFRCLSLATGPPSSTEIAQLRFGDGALHAV